MARATNGGDAARPRGSGAGSRVGRLRLVAQRIAGPALGTPREVVAHLTAVQGQDLPGALTSVALRTRARSVTAVRTSLDTGQVVRSWPVRGTLHLVLAEDLPWLTSLLAPRVLASTTRRRAQLELDDHTCGRAEEVAVSALRGGQRLGRHEIQQRWERAGIGTASQRGYHLLLHLSLRGTLCLGPMRDGEQQFVLVEEWVTQPRRLEREEALAELATRYFRSHGPATVRDLARWAALPMADARAGARAGLALARQGLEVREWDGVEHFCAPETLERARRATASTRSPAGVCLLPGFDEFVLGYADRSAILDPSYAERIVPGGNGVFQPTVVSAGRVVGTWKATGTGGNRSAAIYPFEPLDDEVNAAIPQVFAALPA